MAETQTVEQLLDQIIERYRPGGEFGKGEEALLGRAKTKSVASFSQGMVSRGLSNTSTAATGGSRWEEEVGMPARLGLEDIRSQRLTSALGAKAGYMERTEARKGQTALDLYRIRQSQPTLAEQGLNAFGQPFAGTQQTSGGGGGTAAIPSTHSGGGSFSIDGSGAYDNSGSYGSGENWMDMYDPNKSSYDPTIGQQVLPGGPDEGKFVTSSGELSEGTMGGTSDAAWNAFLSGKGKELGVQNSPTVRKMWESGYFS